MTEQQLIIFVELYANNVAGNPHRPGLLDQVPARSGFKSQVLVLLAFAQMKEIIRQANAVMGLTLINEKAFLDLAAIHIVKGINHVGKTTPYRSFNQLVMRYLVVIKLHAGVQKLAASRGDLLRSLFQMFAKMAAERHGEFVEGDDVAARLINLIQGMCKRELVRCDVLSKKITPRK